MISGTHTYIRSAEPDDAPVLFAAYDLERPRSCLLDGKREPLIPTRDELREVLGRKEAAQGTFYAVEDSAGRVRGFCGLRGVNPEACFGEVYFLLLDEEDYGRPLAGEVFAFVCGRAFARLGLHKVVAHALDSEVALRAFLVAHGFESGGIQREAVYARGRRHHLETFSLFADAVPKNTAGPGCSVAAAEG